MTRTVDATESAPRRTATAWRPVWLIAAVIAVIHLAVAARYGWHHDEFYYVMTGRHPAWGYVDQPPLVPFLARLAAALPGGVLPLRVLAIAAQVGCVLLGAVLAAEFGGGRRAQVIAAAAVGACLVFVGSSLLFGTTVTDQVVWLALFVLVARALRLGTTGAWLWAGLVAGIGLENKDTVAVLLAGIAAGLLVYRRDVLRTPGPWLAGALAVVLALPNVVWDALHSWPNITMAHALAAKQGGPLGALSQVPLLALIGAGPPLIALWVLGVRWLGSPDGRGHRWLLAATVLVVAVFTVTSGKDYYSAPMLAALFAAGAVRVEARWRPRSRIRWSVSIVVTGLIAVLLELPVLPVAAANSLRAASPELMQTYGWPQLVEQVTHAAATLPSGTPIFTSDYGEAGALAILGPTAGLHDPIYSGHNNYTLWGPPPGSPDTVLCVGKFKVGYLHSFWSQVREIEPVTLPNGLVNSDVADHAAIWLCQQPHGTWTQLWPAMRHFD
jgi:hypothetical protein